MLNYIIIIIFCMLIASVLAAAGGVAMGTAAFQSYITTGLIIGVALSVFKWMWGELY